MANKKITPEQQREALKDSIINASFKGLVLGESYTNIMETLDSMKQNGAIEAIKTVEESERLEDLCMSIKAHKLPSVTMFDCTLVLRDGEQYNETKVQCGLGFLDDSLYTIMLLPSKYRSDLKRDKVIGTYTAKYGGLYYIDDAEEYSFYGREYLGGEGWHYNQVYETTSMSTDNLVWRYKDAEIYQCDITERITVYTFDEDDFLREVRNMPYEDGKSAYRMCERIKDRLYSTKKYTTSEESFIAYKYMPLHLKESARLNAIAEENNRIYALKKAKQAQEDSLKNESVKSTYLNQDI